MPKKAANPTPESEFTSAYTKFKRNPAPANYNAMMTAARKHQNAWFEAIKAEMAEVAK